LAPGSFLLSEKKWYLKVDFWLLCFSLWHSILVLERRTAIRTEHKCMRYVIRVKGHLDPFWQDWFENLVITHEREGTTLLSGHIRDQAALYGILIKMRESSTDAPRAFVEPTHAVSRGVSSFFRLLLPLLCKRHGTLPT
jgi:hypothetical protein